jgi:SPP1 gp7 family putative phage head morphogenesis protein
VWDGKAGFTDAGILKLVGSVLEQQVFNGFGKNFSTVDFTTPDGEMLTRLTRDVWQFSAAKNYQELRDLTLALKGDDGKLRSFEQFKEAAGAIDEKFNNNWLKTEYNFAVNSSTLAARWNEYVKHAKEMPYLRYQTVGDNRVRIDHQALDGIIKKITDEFWAYYYPPNGWGCRCGAIQLPGSYAVETENVPHINIPGIFQTNLAQTGLIFPKGHAYYEGVPTKVIKEALIYLPEDALFKTVQKWDTGGELRIHILHGINEASENVHASKLLSGHFNHKYNIDLMPILKGVKNPDARVDGKLWEFKSFSIKWNESSTKKSFIEYYRYKINHALHEGGKQADNIAIFLPEKINEDIIRRAVDGYKKGYKKTRKIIIFNGDITHEY